MRESRDSMKVKNGFILRKVGKQFVVAATGEASKNFNGMIRLNDEAAFAFGQLQGGTTEEELIAALQGVSPQTARVEKAEKKTQKKNRNPPASSVSAQPCRSRFPAVSGTGSDIPRRMGRKRWRYLLPG